MGDILQQSHPLEGKLPPVSGLRGYYDAIIRHSYVTARHRRMKIYSLASETPFSYLFLIHF